jgi:FkbM family methyltransferase
MQIFSISYTLTVARLIMAYPAAISRLPQGSGEVARYIRGRIKTDYKRNATAIAKHEHLRFLLRNDDSGYGACLMQRGLYEPEVLRISRHILKEGDVVVDAGANIGWHTIHFAKYVGESGMVFAFEPELSNFEYLSKSVSLNNLRNVALRLQCLSNLNGKVLLYRAKPGESGSDSIVRRKSEATVMVDSTSLDHFWRQNELDRVHLLKIDVEAAEPLVIDGGLEHLDKVSHIIMEWNREVWQDRYELLGRLARQFEIYEVRIGFPFLIKRIENPVKSLPLIAPTSGMVYMRNRAGD